MDVEGGEPDPVGEPVAPSGPWAAFRSREFRMFWVAALVSNSGSWMQTVSVPYVLDQLTHSTVWVGVGVVCTFFPSTLLGPLGGSLADRYSRRTVLMWAQGAAMVSAFALWLNYSSGTATPYSILALVVIGSSSNGITASSWQAFVPQLVAPDNILSAVRINSMGLTGARAFGPALAGLVLATLGAGAAFLANGVSYAFVIGALLLIAPRPVGDHAQEAGGVVSHFSDGIRYLRTRRVLVLAVLGACVSTMLGVGIVQLAEPISRRLFDSSPAEYGLLLTVYGAGAAVGAVLVVAKGDVIRRSSLVVVGFAGFVVGEVGLGFAPVYTIAVVAFVVMGISQVAVNVACQTSLQVNVPEQYRGRVLSVYLMGFFAFVPLGALLASIAMTLVGMRATIVGVAVVFAACVMVLYLRFDRFRLLDASLSGRFGRVDPSTRAAPGTDVDAPTHAVAEAVE